MLKYKILIFGASGFIGNNLFSKFLKKKYFVTGTYNRNKKRGLIKFDLLKDNLNKLKNLNNYSHFIFCQGGNTSLDNIELNWRSEKKIYQDETKKIISKLSKFKKKIIFISSDAVFDGKKGNYKEKSIKNPVNFYGKFKHEVENYIIKNLQDFLLIFL